jgi:hypothetical protein
MIEFKKPLEIFRVNADATFELGKGVDPLVALGELSKAFMRQQSRIKRLEESLRQIANQDYRGNRSTESQIAFDALKEAK